MKITICALVGPPTETLGYGGTNPWLFQRKFELELLELTSEMFVSLLRHGILRIQDRCVLKIHSNRDGDFIGVSLVGNTPEIKMTGSLWNNTQASIDAMISDGWEIVLTANQDQRRFNFNIPNCPEESPQSIWDTP